MSQNLDFVRSLVRKGGPDPSDYAHLDDWLSKLYDLSRAGTLSESDVMAIRESLGSALGPETMQGRAYTKPRGYAGDYEVIDYIYQERLSGDSDLVKWDHYYHQHAATKAVRNRKAYFQELLDTLCATKKSPRVLELGSGPGRVIFDWLSRNPQADVTFECVDVDPDAVLYANALNYRFRDRVRFVHRNALRYQVQSTFDLVWAAGLFDYFSDRVFISLLRRMLPAVAPGGEIVVGNFSDENPSRPYMELIGDWNLRHRSARELLALAAKAGANLDHCFVGSESEFINLFLHIRKPLVPP